MSAAAGGGTDYLLVLGSNQAPARHLRLAARRIGADFDVRACTPAMRTRDGNGQRYLNAALRLRSGLPLPALREALRAIEAAAGRRRGSSTVTLDIDIIASQQQARWQVHKPDDLARGYVRTLLQALGIDPDLLRQD